MPTAKGRIAVFPRGVLCTFWPQKVPKTPRRMPSPTSSRLTFETGARLKGGFKGRWAAERVISDTTLSLLKPASYAGTFSRDFVSRLRHRNGTVRRETRREGCVRDKQEAQKPTIAPGSGFQPPHSRLQRNKNNRQPACPEREAGKGVRRRGQTACCLPSRHSLNGACFCAVKARFYCARSARTRGQNDMRSEGTPARTACGWFWVPFTTKRYITASVKHSEKRIGIFVT